MPSSSPELFWIPEAVAKLLATNHIHDRAGLIKSIPGASHGVVYRTFGEDWSGKVNTRVLAELAVHFAIPLSALVQLVVVDPTASSPLETPSSPQRKAPLSA